MLLDKEGNLKLTDFGLSKKITKESNRASTICGTPEYLAPEILMGKGYDKNVDWWSLGCVIYEMLNGISPFYFVKDKNVDINIYNKKIDIPYYFSFEASNLVNSLLQVDCKARLGYGPKDAEAIKNHEFFNGIDWNKVKNKKILCPIRPKLSSNEDLSYFEKSKTEINTSFERDKSVGLQKSEEEDDDFKFANFNYVKPAEDINNNTK